MKVLSATPMTWSSNIHCSSCYSSLEVELSDLKRIQGFDQRDNDSWDYVVFTCPVCGTPNSPSGLIDKIPMHLRNKIKK